MIVPATVMQQLLKIEHEYNHAIQQRDEAALVIKRRDEAFQLVIATLGASPNAQIVLQADGTGIITESAMQSDP
jgi:hypothetical protein